MRIYSIRKMEFNQGTYLKVEPFNMLGVACRDITDRFKNDYAHAIYNFEPKVQ